MLILKSFLPSNNKKIGIFPFASTCVREAILKFTDFSVNKQDNNISYNQWGYQNAAKGSNYLIEDSADTLTEINTNIFSNTKSNFIIWSLPKILGTHSGSIIWCRNIEDSKLLKSIISSSKPKMFILILKILSHYNMFFYNLWNKKIYNNVNLNKIELSEIFYKTKQLKSIISDRKRKILLFNSINKNKHILKNNFYPSVIPLEKNKYKTYEKFLKSSFGLRHFLFSNENEYVKVFPLPIHQDISYEKLKEFKECFYDKK